MVICIYCKDPAQFQIGLKVNGVSNRFSYTEMYVCEFHKGDVSVVELLQSTAWRTMVQEAVDTNARLPGTLSVEAEYYRLRTPVLPYED